MSKLKKRLVYDLLSPEEKELVKGIEGAFVGETQVKHLKKTGFSASGLFYSSGQCARKWQLLFDGVDAEDEWSHSSLRAVAAGTSSHEDLQEKLKAKMPHLEIEKEFWHENPSMHGFVDAYDPILNIPIEIKTTRTEAYGYREANMNGVEYHVNQLLVYCKHFRSKMGLFIYEDRNSFDFIVIPVFVDNDKKRTINRVFDWMRKIEEVHASGERIKVFANRRSNSKLCGECPISKACAEAPEGTVDIPLLKKYTGE